MGKILCGVRKIHPIHMGKILHGVRKIHPIHMGKILHTPMQNYSYIDRKASVRMVTLFNSTFSYIYIGAI